MRRLNRLNFLLTLSLLFLDKGYIPEQNTMSTCLDISTNVVREIKRPALVVDYNGGDFTPKPDFLNIINKAHRYLDRRYSHENREIETRLALAEDAYTLTTPEETKHILRIDLEDSEGNIIPSGGLQHVELDWLREYYGERFDQVDPGQPKYWAHGDETLAESTYEQIVSEFSIARPTFGNFSDPVYYLGAIYIVTSDTDGGYSLYGFNTATGEIVLQNQFLADSDGAITVILSLCNVGGTFYVIAVGDSDFVSGTGQWGLYAISSEDGTIASKISMQNAGWDTNGANHISTDGTDLFLSSGSQVAKVATDGTYDTIVTAPSTIEQFGFSAVGDERLWVSGRGLGSAAIYIIGYSTSDMSVSVPQTYIRQYGPILTDVSLLLAADGFLYCDNLALSYVDLSVHHSIPETTGLVTAFGTGFSNVGLGINGTTGHQIAVGATGFLDFAEINLTEVATAIDAQIITMPPADESYTAVVRHASYAVEMDSNADVSWWSDKHPDILELAVKRQIAIDVSRNRAEQEDYEKIIEPALYDLETDAALEKYNGPPVTRRFGWRPS